MSSVSNLARAKRQKKDEFYTQLRDIENELRHYKDHFHGKVVYCNCDDPRVSNFFHYFAYNFHQLKLKKLITTCYMSQQPDMFSNHDSERAVYLEYAGEGGRAPDLQRVSIRLLNGNGDFRSNECVEILKKADIVVTNPPFSLFRDYVAQLIHYNKHFIIVGHQNAIVYKEIFPLIRQQKIWLGHGFKGNASHFLAPNYKDYTRATDRKLGMIRVSGVVWFTNLDHAKRHEELQLYARYSNSKYPSYDNCNAIEVSKTKDIPADWAGVMGVPITYLTKHNPDQFEILYGTTNPHYTKIAGRPKYARLFIRNRKLQP